MRIFLLLGTTLVFPIALTHAQPVNSVVHKLSKSEEELVQICTEMDSAFDEYYSRADKLKNETEREKYFSENYPAAKYVARLMKFERANHGTHAGLMAVRRLVLLGAAGGKHGGPQDVGRQRALAVLPDYANAPELPEIIRYLNGGNVEPASERILRQLMNMPDISEQNRDFARYMLANWALTMRDGMEYREHRLRELAEGSPVRYLREKEHLSESLRRLLLLKKPAELEREAVKILVALVESNSVSRQPSVTGVDKKWIIVRIDPKKTKNTRTVKERAAGTLFAEQHLRVGKPVPELKLQLVSGKQWSISEQRGKAVVIQFSFKGCGPCEAMYGDLRSLAEQYKGQLSILSVMVDKNRKDTVDAVNSGKMSWNVSWDGAKGPIATKWAVTSFPTVYVIGPDGRIVARGLRGEQLKTQIAKLAR